MIDVGPIRQKHVGNGAFVLVVAVRLDGDFFAKGEGRGGVLGALAVGLTFLGAVDAPETDTFGVLVVQDFDAATMDACV